MAINVAEPIANAITNVSRTRLSIAEALRNAAQKAKEDAAQEYDAWRQREAAFLADRPAEYVAAYGAAKESQFGGDPRKMTDIIAYLARGGPKGLVTGFTLDATKPVSVTPGAAVADSESAVPYTPGAGQFKDITTAPALPPMGPETRAERLEAERIEQARREKDPWEPMRQAFRAMSAPAQYALLNSAKPDMLPPELRSIAQMVRGVEPTAQPAAAPSSPASTPAWQPPSASIGWSLRRTPTPSVTPTAPSVPVAPTAAAVPTPPAVQPVAPAITKADWIGGEKPMTGGQRANVLLSALREVMAHPEIFSDPKNFKFLDTVANLYNRYLGEGEAPITAEDIMVNLPPTYQARIENLQAQTARVRQQIDTDRKKLDAYLRDVESRIAARQASTQIQARRAATDQLSAQTAMDRLKLAERRGMEDVEQRRKQFALDVYKEIGKAQAALQQLREFSTGSPADAELESYYKGQIKKLQGLLPPPEVQRILEVAARRGWSGKMTKAYLIQEFGHDFPQARAAAGLR